jgi:hypothetical protein
MTELKDIYNALLAEESRGLIRAAIAESFDEHEVDMQVENLLAEAAKGNPTEVFAKYGIDKDRIEGIGVLAAKSAAQRYERYRADMTRRAIPSMTDEQLSELYGEGRIEYSDLPESYRERKYGAGRAR